VFVNMPGRTTIKKVMCISSVPVVWEVQGLRPLECVPGQIEVTVFVRHQ
jgi:hypothetical protein